jgi:DNA (cytosine-5)-methyltransferase 1
MYIYPLDVLKPAGKTQACLLDFMSQAFLVKIKFIDLFAGIGGFHRALSSFGENKGECVLACEMDQQCRLVYAANFSAPSQFPENIRELTRSDISNPNSDYSLSEINDKIPNHNVLCAGFPCQPFSKSGKQQGIKDQTRGTLFYDIMQIIRAKSPRYILLENVRNLSGPKHRETLDIINKSLRDEGYAILEDPIILSPHQLSPQDGGAPQVRERVFILAIKGLKNSFRLHQIAKEVELIRSGKSGWSPDGWKTSDILRPDTEIPDVTKYRLSDEAEAWLAAWDDFVAIIPSDNLPGFPIWADVFKDQRPRTAGLPEWKVEFLNKNHKFFLENREVILPWLSRHKVSEFPASRRKFEWQARQHHKSRKGRTIRDLVIQMRPSGIRVKPPTYLPALVAITQTSIIGPGVSKGKIKKYRLLTPFEAAALQGMPGDFFTKRGLDIKESVAFKQLGNAVNVGVVRFLATRLIK